MPAHTQPLRIVMAFAVAIVFGTGHIVANAQESDEKNPAELFDQLDKNKDGILKADEVSEEQGKFFDRLIRVGDRDDNGELSKEEFLRGLRPDDRPVGNAEQPGRGPGRRGDFDPRRIFEQFDRNKDGKLTLSEVPEPLRDRFKPMFERLGETEMTLEAFSRMRGRPGGEGTPPRGAGPSRNAGQPGGDFFSRLDKNEDGKVTLEELPEDFRDRMKQMFERAGKDALTREDFARFGRRPSQAMTPEQAAEAFARLDANGDGKVESDEIPEEGRYRIAGIFRAAGKERGDSITKEEFVKAAAQAPGRPGEGRPGEGRRRRPAAEGDRPEGDRPETGRPETGRPETGRPDGDRRPEGDRPEGGRPEGRRPGAGGPPPGEFRGPLFFRLVDTNKDGQISKAELGEAVNKFAELDANQDGNLDPREMFGFPGGDRRPEMRSGGRGGLPGRPDSEGGRPQRPPAEGGNRPERPGDRDGGGDRISAFVDKYFRDVDKDADGKITKDEATDKLKESFDSFDVNKDGGVDRKEFAGQISKLRARPDRN